MADENDALGEDAEAVEDEPLVFEHEGTSLAIHAGFVELSVGKRRRTLQLDELADALAERRPKRLILVTKAGKKHEVLLGSNTEAARAVVASRIAQHS